MNYTIAAHPTRYKNTIFRSRLEARWAAFFDLWGWRWEYEPVDLQGWTPDFRLWRTDTLTSSDCCCGLRRCRDSEHTISCTQCGGFSGGKIVWQEPGPGRPVWHTLEPRCRCFRKVAVEVLAEVKPFDSYEPWEEVTKKIRAAIPEDRWSVDYYRLGNNPDCSYLSWDYGDLFHKEQDEAMKVWEEAGNLTRYQPKK